MFYTPTADARPLGYVVPPNFPKASAVPVAAMPIAADASETAPRRKRLKPGERRSQILQTLADMLAQSGSERVTTALLAARLQVSEAALYRHFASKTQIFEALLELVELAVDGLIGETVQAPGTGRERAAQLMTRLFAFAEEHPGLARVLAGDALAFEHERLQDRMNALLGRFEAALKLCLQADGTPTPAIGADMLTACAVGRLHMWSRSGFKRKPTANLSACLAYLGC